MSTGRLVGGHPSLIFSVLNKEIDGEPDLIFDWQDWGRLFTALAFMIVNKGGGDVTVTPEISPDQTNIASAGIGVPAALVVASGKTSMDPYGVDLMAPWWRLWITASGAASVCDVYVYGIARGSRA
jgi:hypothetical protein